MNYPFLKLIPGVSLKRSNSVGHTSAAISMRESFSEVERAKINQESLFHQIKISHGLFTSVSILLLIPYVTLIELYGDSNDIIGALKNRLFLYLTPFVMLLMSLFWTGFFCYKAKESRDAARKWFAITPARNRQDGTAQRSRRVSRNGDTLPLKGKKKIYFLILYSLINLA